jgi:hypothetical protein
MRQLDVNGHNYVYIFFTSAQKLIQKNLDFYVAEIGWFRVMVHGETQIK